MQEKKHTCDFMVNMSFKCNSALRVLSVLHLEVFVTAGNHRMMPDDLDVVERSITVN